jgi:predicted  nucleic acid-binding Zn-ribbon protein
MNKKHLKRALQIEKDGLAQVAREFDNVDNEIERIDNELKTTNDNFEELNEEIKKKLLKQ